jgi:hypothetical protein
MFRGAKTVHTGFAQRKAAFMRGNGASLPKYRKHRASGQAVVTLCGVDHYLGPHGTRASKSEYDRLIAEGRVVKILSRTKNARKQRFQPLDGQPTSEVGPARHDHQIPYNRTVRLPSASFSPPHSIDGLFALHDREDFGIVTSCPSFSTRGNSTW